MKDLLHEQLITSKITFNNRLVMPPMQTQICTEEGFIADEAIKFYEDRIKSGKIGLVIVEHSFVSEEGRACRRQVCVSSDEMIPGLKNLADTIKKYGSKACLQLSHAGGSAFPNDKRVNAIGPSAVKCIRTGVMPAEMTKEDIHRIVSDFGKAAFRARTAGFDAVEVHSAHGYLLNQFLSPYSNRRRDEYGGTLENRVRIHREIIREIRKEVGEEFPVLLRLGAKDYYVEGTKIQDGIEASLIFEKDGIDILDISGGMSIWKNPENSGPGFFKELSKPIKEALSIPVILTGGVTKSEEAEKLLEEGDADMIGVGRAIFNDPEWADKNM